MKRYNGRNLRKPYRWPIIGRALLALLFVIFPFVAPLIILWEARDDLAEEWGEIGMAAFFPRKRDD